MHLKIKQKEKLKNRKNKSKGIKILVSLEKGGGKVFF